MIIKKVINVDDYYFDVFMSVSEAITGFSSSELQSTGLAETYYNHILASMEAATFIEFLSTSKSILDTSFSKSQLNDAIAARLVGNPSLHDITNKVITLWYLGSWDGAYVSDLSYKEGLVWKVMSGHPPGAKQPGFKSWSLKPLTANV